ncbi:MAG TPA: hypothetical protein VJQ50_01130 [Terriglobales bacterium]|nr:hypothetical protein [Terriglobales bacterium]
MKTRFALLVALLAITALALAPAASAQVHSGGFIPVAAQQLTFTLPGQTTSTTGTLTGIKVTSITSTGSGLVASGLATVVTSTGTLIGSFTNATLDPSGTCPILHLTIGPINLNLLGLVVSVPNPIVVDITAQAGPGNLLGNLLCNVANLLNQSPAPLTQIAGLLQQILSLL